MIVNVKTVDPAEASPQEDVPAGVANGKNAAGGEDKNATGSKDGNDDGNPSTEWSWNFVRVCVRACVCACVLLDK